MRRGEDSVTIGAAQVHALLAGRLAQDRPARAAGSPEAPHEPVPGGPPAVPTGSPSRFHTPVPDRTLLVLRAAARHRFPAGHRHRIGPAARRRFLALLSTDGPGAWEQPADGGQSTVKATFRRVPGNLLAPGGEERVDVTLGTIEPSLDVVADLLIPLPTTGPLRPAEVVDLWARLARRCTASVAGVVAALAAGSTSGAALELHLEVVGTTAVSLEDVLDLTGLGVPDLPQRAAAAVAWPWAAVTLGAERRLAMDALRTACLDGARSTLTGPCARWAGRADARMTGRFHREGRWSLR